MKFLGATGVRFSDGSMEPEWFISFLIFINEHEVSFDKHNDPIRRGYNTEVIFIMILMRVWLLLGQGQETTMSKDTFSACAVHTRYHGRFLYTTAKRKE